MSSPSSVVWVDGQLLVDDQLPDDVALLLGTELGMSPAVYVHRDELLHAHVRMLSLAADTLGYEGFEAARTLAALEAATASSAGTVRVSLVPDPASHKAMPPGHHWSPQVEAFTPPPMSPVDSPAGLRLATGAHRRNQTSPAAGIVLRDDAELRAGAVQDPQVDLTVWGDLAGNVACVDQHALFTRSGGRLVTPPLSDAAPRTAWRHALLTGRDVAESSLPLAELSGDTPPGALVCLSPWGDPRPVASVDGRSVDIDATAALVDELRERMEDLRR